LHLNSQCRVSGTAFWEKEKGGINSSVVHHPSKKNKKKKLQKCDKKPGKFYFKKGEKPGEGLKGGKRARFEKRWGFQGTTGKGKTGGKRSGAKQKRNGWGLKGLQGKHR